VNQDGGGERKKAWVRLLRGESPKGKRGPSTNRGEKENRRLSRGWGKLFLKKKNFLSPGGKGVGVSFFSSTLVGRGRRVFLGRKNRIFILIKVQTRKKGEKIRREKGGKGWVS